MEIFSSIPTTIAGQPLVTCILIGICFLLIIAVFMLQRRVSRLLAGKDAQSLEDTIVALQKHIADLQEFQNGSEKYFESVEHRLRRSVQGVETIRFNPWKGTGSAGNQSFATALVNEHGDGVVISSLYSRDRVSVFAKPVKKLHSEFDLSEEETEVLLAAKETISK